MRTMMISRIFFGWFYLSFILGSVESTGWVKSLGRWVTDVSDVRQVRFTLNFGGNRTFPYPELQEIFVEFVERIPTRIEEIEDLRATAEDVNHFFNGYTTLFVMIEESNDHLNVYPSRDSIDVISEILGLASTNILFVLISPEAREGFEPLLHYAWSKSLLDFTIVELVRPKTKGKLTYVDWFSDPIVHRYDPFRREYARKNWCSSEEWFPKKSGNMHGYPFNVGVMHEPPLSYLEIDRVRQRLTRMSGANIDMVKLIAEQLNFTVNWLPITRFREIDRDPTPSGYRDLMSSGKLDMLATLAPHHTVNWKTRIDRTTSIKLDSLCAVVPILPSYKMPALWDLLKVHAMCFGITFVYWLLRSLFKFNRRIWQPINVTRILFGVGMTRTPTRNVERVMFTCLLAIAAINSSNIYSALTRVSFDTVATHEINSFEDLDRSGLQPVINFYVYNKTFDHVNTEALISLKKKIRLMRNIHPCLSEALKHKNVTCLMNRAEANEIFRRNKNKYENKVKVLDSCCFWTDSYAFLLRKNSPFREDIRNAVVRSHVSGLSTKLYTNLDITKVGTDKDDEDISATVGGRNEKELLYEMVAILVVGYSVSLLAFIGEIVVYRVKKYRDRK